MHLSLPTKLKLVEMIRFESNGFQFEEQRIIHYSSLNREVLSIKSTWKIVELWIRLKEIPFISFLNNLFSAIIMSLIRSKAKLKMAT